MLRGTNVFLFWASYVSFWYIDNLMPVSIIILVLPICVLNLCTQRKEGLRKGKCYILCHVLVMVIEKLFITQVILNKEVRSVGTSYYSSNTISPTHTWLKHLLPSLRLHVVCHESCILVKYCIVELPMTNIINVLLILISTIYED